MGRRLTKLGSDSNMMEKKGSRKFLLVRVPPKPCLQSSASQTRNLLTDASSSSAAASAVGLSLCHGFPNQAPAVTHTFAVASSSSSPKENKERVSNLLNETVSTENYSKVEKDKNESQYVSTDLSLSIFGTFSDDQNKVKPSTASNKRKPFPDRPMKAAKRMHGSGRNPEEMQWGFSTDLKLHEDPWKIKKVLSESDTGILCRLLLATNLVEKLMLPVLGMDAQRDIETVEKGIQIEVWDIDTNTTHYLILKYRVSPRSYVLIGKWHVEFVKRRCLKKGDEIGFHFDPYKHRFNFSILKRV